MSDVLLEIEREILLYDLRRHLLAQKVFFAWIGPLDFTWGSKLDIHGPTSQESPNSMSSLDSQLPYSRYNALSQPLTAFAVIHHFYNDIAPY